MRNPLAKLTSRLSRTLEELRVGSDSATRRGKPAHYGKGEHFPLASEAIFELVAASPWLAQEMARGLPPNVPIHVLDWGDFVRVQDYGVQMAKMDKALQNAISLIGKAHQMPTGSQANIYDVTGAAPASATLRAFKKAHGPAKRPDVAMAIETHLLRMGTDPKDAIWHALGLWPPDCQGAFYANTTPYVAS